jgi:UDP-N-acetylmuramyl pentapeptide phosphotransferase/UDP-N-acetylglucosamine-1-phosphate transferase
LLVERQLHRAAILDRPNTRSLHSEPKPWGGGLAVVAVILLGWLIMTATGVVSTNSLIIVPAAAVLAGISWRDDLKPLSPLTRLTVQVVAVGLGVSAFDDSLVLQGLVPWWLDRLVAAVAWLWFTNLYNFMDGIDGITGMESAAIGIGIVLVTALVGAPAAEIAAIATLTAGAALGFLWRNWHPATIFLGDVGSVPLGFIVGWLLLQCCLAGVWAPAVILPLYYLADATLTLLRRLRRGERPWDAHREHFYQMAVRAGLGHDQVTLRVLGVNVGLVLLAALATATGPLAILPAGAAVAALLWQFQRLPPRS